MNQTKVMSEPRKDAALATGEKHKAITRLVILMQSLLVLTLAPEMCLAEEQEEILLRPNPRLDYIDQCGLASPAELTLHSILAEFHDYERGDQTRTRDSNGDLMPEPNDPSVRHIHSFMIDSTDEPDEKLAAIRQALPGLNDRGSFVCEMDLLEMPQDYQGVPIECSAADTDDHSHVRIEFTATVTEDQILLRGPAGNFSMQVDYCLATGDLSYSLTSHRGWNPRNYSEPPPVNSFRIMAF